MGIRTISLTRWAALVVRTRKPESHMDPNGPRLEEEATALCKSGESSVEHSAKNETNFFVMQN